MAFLEHCETNDDLMAVAKIDDMDEESDEDLEKTTEDQLVNPRPFLIFWQNRFVPEANIPRLHFYPQTETIKMNNEVKKQWKRKVIGFLFLDWTFKSISNNKLKVLLTPDEWVLHNSTTSQPRNSQEKFLE
jgi:hypothetical protein